MSDLPLHPLIVHLPLGLAVVMPLFVLLLAWLLMTERLPRRAWLLALLLQVLLAGSAYAAMRTGEADEEKVVKVVAKEHIEEHAERAQQFLIAAGATAGLFLVVLVLPGLKGLQFGLVLAVLGSLATLVLGFRTGEAGGQLVYKHGAAAVHK
jgi:uncharacterized membrane protein